eukprot:NODE_12251_length_1236_cov_5.800721.p2 GENE.NODE_12251_length_1236_cov_5.800721~~NODE_12251_length_1236_cov_5.800721.p2  ORF type:complete len:206 (+),score=49.40 NODE_12251_length_1236_cov_5.800721:415-1032(+)
MHSFEDHHHPRGAPFFFFRKIQDLAVELQVEFEDIFATERRVLMNLQFKVTTPSPYDVLDSLCPLIVLPGARVGDYVSISIARFLLYLPCFDVKTHYSTPHFILAASSLYLGLCAVRAAPALLAVLVRDTSFFCADIPDVHEDMMASVRGLLTLWEEFAETKGTQYDDGALLLYKYRSQRMQHIMVNPPTTPLPHTRDVLDATVG